MDDAVKSGTFDHPGPEPLPLDRFLRARFPGASWGELRRLIHTGKVHIEGQVVTDERRRVNVGTRVSVDMNRPRKAIRRTASDPRILHVDPHIVVVNKPSGLSTVDHDAEPSSLQAEIRRSLERLERRSTPQLLVVQRLDKVTSGVMVFARTSLAEEDLAEQFRSHTTGRTYRGVAHGQVRSQTFRGRLVKDRGDGFRGVTTDANEGYHAVTHVTAKVAYEHCTLVECQLETGRTHQIRIHLADAGHPLVGDPLYTRDYRGTLLESATTLLHAATLSFAHPVFRTPCRFSVPPPEAFEDFLKGQRARSRG